jgi:hypothetical protein
MEQSTVSNLFVKEKIGQKFHLKKEFIDAESRGYINDKKKL